MVRTWTASQALTFIPPLVAGSLRKLDLLRWKVHKVQWSLDLSLIDLVGLHLALMRLLLLSGILFLELNAVQEFSVEVSCLSIVHSWLHRAERSCGLASGIDAYSLDRSCICIVFEGMLFLTGDCAALITQRSKIFMVTLLLVPIASTFLWGWWHDLEFTCLLLGKLLWYHEVATRVFNGIVTCDLLLLVTLDNLWRRHMES